MHINLKVILALLITCVVLTNSQPAACELGDQAIEWQIADFEADEPWSGSGDSIDTIYYVEGSQGRRLAGGGGTETLSRLNKGMDLTMGGYSSDADYIHIAFYIENPAGTAKISLEMLTDAASLYYCSWPPPDYAVGWNYGLVRKSDFVAVNSPDWANIHTIQIRALADGPDPSFVTFDDWRVIKANRDRRTYLPIILR